FNGDGVTDLLVNQFFAANLFVGNGDGTFTTEPSTAPTEPGILVADVNGDGKLDVVNFDGRTATLGNGDGTFGGTVNFVPSWINPQIWTNSVGSATFTLADFSGDDRPGVVLEPCGTDWTVFAAEPAGSANTGFCDFRIRSERNRAREF